MLCPSRELACPTHRVAQQLLADSGLRSGIVAGGANPNRQIERLRKERPQLLIGTAGRVGELAYESKKLKLQRVRHLVLDEVDEALVAPHAEPTRRVLDDVSDGRPLQLLFCSATAAAGDARAALQLMRPPPSSSASPVGAGLAVPRRAAPSCRRRSRTAPFQRWRGATSRCSAGCVPELADGARVRQLAAPRGRRRRPAVDGERRRRRAARRRPGARGAGRRCGAGRRQGAAGRAPRWARAASTSHLTHVVNLELPTDAAHYAHRAGRRGRAGRAGTVVSVVADDRAFVVDKIAAQLGVEDADAAYEGKLVEGAEFASRARRGPPPRRRAKGRRRAGRPRRAAAAAAAAAARRG